MITLKKYSNPREIKDILIKYYEDLEPPVSRVNVLVKLSTIKQAKELCTELDISKSELIRRVIAKEYRRIFE